VAVGHGIEAFKASLLKAIAGGGAPAAKPQVTDEATLQAGQTILKSGLAISVAQSTKVPRFKTPSLSVRGDCSSRTAATQLPNYPAPTLLHSRARTPITDAAIARPTLDAVQRICPVGSRRYKNKQAAPSEHRS